MKHEWLDDAGLPVFRRRARRAWANANEAFMVLSTQVDVTAALRRVERSKTASPVSLVGIFVEAYGRAFIEVPDANTLYAGRGLVRRTGVAAQILVKVNDSHGESSLARYLVRDVETKDASAITGELVEAARRLRAQGTESPHQTDRLPGMLFRAYGRLRYRLGVDWGVRIRGWTTSLDDVPSIIVSNIGPLGMELGIAAPVPFSRHPMMASIGSVVFQPRYGVDGTLQKRALVWNTVVADHRIMDADHVARFLNSSKRVIEGDNDD
jgi:pyruvate/2-oxoglutarate dehydrogenase complex dihydrolipoamide acyltransferase (E2) component